MVDYNQEYKKLTGAADVVVLVFNDVAPIAAEIMSREAEKPTAGLALALTNYTAMMMSYANLAAASSTLNYDRKSIVRDAGIVAAQEHLAKKMADLRETAESFINEGAVAVKALWYFAGREKKLQSALEIVQAALLNITEKYLPLALRLNAELSGKRAVTGGAEGFARLRDSLNRFSASARLNAEPIEIVVGGAGEAEVLVVGGAAESIIKQHQILRDLLENETEIGAGEYEEYSQLAKMDEAEMADHMIREGGLDWPLRKQLRHISAGDCALEEVLDHYASISCPCPSTGFEALFERSAKIRDVAAEVRAVRGGGLDSVIGGSSKKIIESVRRSARNLRNTAKPKVPKVIRTKPTTNKEHPKVADLRDLIGFVINFQLALLPFLRSYEQWINEITGGLYEIALNVNSIRDPRSVLSESAQQRAAEMGFRALMLGHLIRAREPKLRDEVEPLEREVRRIGGMLEMDFDRYYHPRLGFRSN